MLLKAKSFVWAKEKALKDTFFLIHFSVKLHNSLKCHQKSVKYYLNSLLEKLKYCKNQKVLFFILLGLIMRAA